MLQVHRNHRSIGSPRTAILLLCVILPAILMVRAAGAQEAAADPEPAADQSRDRATIVERRSALSAPMPLEQLTVVASKIPRMLRDVTGTISVLRRDEIEFQQVLDIEDLVRYDPALSVPRDGTRFGSSGFTIRGIGGNRVAIELDGVPMADAFTIGSFSNAGRDWIPPQLLQRVEILRGPSSALYGSDAIAGVVILTSSDPGEVIESGDHELLSDVTYASDRGALSGGLTYAAKWDEGGYLISAQALSGNEVEIEPGAAGLQANPQDYRRRSLMGKWRLRGAAWDTRIVLDADRERVHSDVRTGLGERDLSDFTGFPLLVNTTLLLGDDEQERARLSIEAQGLGEGWGRGGTWRAYYLTSETRQDTVEERTTTAFGVSTPSLRQRRFTLQDRSLGSEVFWNRRWNTGDWRQDWVFGADLELTRSEELRDGTETNLDTGEVSNEVAGEVFPVRDFPTTDVLTGAFYAQADITAEASPWTFIPALRAEYYRLDPEVDAVFAADNPDIEPTGYSDLSLAPKLGVIRRLDDSSQAFFQYSRGFRAPPLQDVNFGFALTTLNAVAIPNPDLRPETSDGLEAGYRFADWRGDLNVSLFYTRFDDFIDSRVNQGVDPQTGFLTFQSVNRDRAVIYGVEARGALALNSVASALEGWHVESGLVWMRGEDSERNQPLNSVDPPQWVTRVERQSADGHWRLALVNTLVRAKHDVDQSGETLFEAPGYGVLDLLAEFRPRPGVRVNLGLFNLGDKRYWQWANVRGRPANDPQLEVLSEAGFNFRAAVQLRW